MSPALFDARPPAATAAGTLLKKKPPPTRNPSGAAPSDVAPPAITPCSDRPQTTVVEMDMDPVGGASRGRPVAGNPGERNMESVFSMLFPPPKAERAPPAPPPGLSKPRFVKVRRNPASSRVRPGPAPFAYAEDTADPEYNPFRGAPHPAGDPSGSGGVAAEMASLSGGFGRAEAGYANFAPGNGLNSNQGANRVASAKDSSFGFTFGGKEISSGFEPAKSGNASFVFAGGHSAVGSSDPSHLQGAKNPYFGERIPAAQSGNIKKEATASRSGVFFVASCSKESVVSDRSAADTYDKGAACKLPEEMHKLNIRGSENAGNSRETKGGDHSFGADDGSAFVFVSNRNASSSSGESNFTAGTFVSRNSSKKGSVPDLSSTDRSDKSSVGNLPEEIQKLNINYSNMKSSTDAENASCKSTTSGNCSSGANTILNAGIFASSRTAEHSNFEANMTFRLPDEMRKLNIDVPCNVEGSAKAKGPNKVDRPETFIFGNNQNIGFSYENEIPEELKNVSSGGGMAHQPESWKEDGTTSSTGVFVFGSKSKQNIVSDQNAFDGLDESTTGKLADEIQKLNIGGSGNADNVAKATGEKDNLYSGSGGFVFGCRKNVSGSFEESNSTAGNFVFGSSSKKNNDVPDLNASDGRDRSSTTNVSGASASGSNKNVSGSFGESKPFAGCFVFRSNSTQGVDSCKDGFDSFDQRAFNKLPEEMQKMNIRDCKNSNPVEKAKGVDHVTDESAFVFGSKKESSSSSCETNSTSGFFVFGNSSNRSTVYNEGLADWFDKGNKLQDKLKELNIRGPMDNDHHEKNISDDWKPMTHDSGSFVSACDKTMPTSSGPHFSFHVTSQDSSSGVGGAPAPTGCHARPLADTNASSYSSSFVSVSQSSGCDSTSAGPCEGLGTSKMKFGMPKEDSSWYSKDSSAQRQNSASTVKKGASSHARARKRRGKLRDPPVQSQRGGNVFTSRGTASQINSELDSAGDYSPMDFSPCQLEISTVDEHSREASVASGESIDFGSHYSSTGIKNSVSVDEDLVCATECSDINEEYLKPELHEDDVKQAGHCGTDFTFASCSNGISESGFSFAATTSTPTQSSFSASRHRRKFRTKAGRDPSISSVDANMQFPSPAAQLFPDVSIPAHLVCAIAQADVPSVTPCLEKSSLERNKVTEVRQDSTSMATAGIAAQEACDKWRLRGNQAYANGDLSKAEEYYTKGVNSISRNETLRSCTHALMLCYSNRAATRMSIGRVRAALSDCMMATGIDPDFFKAQLRAANCHLLLGEIEEASTYFKKCLAKGTEVSMDHKFIAEASDGLQKAKRVADYMEHATTLLQKGTNSEATSAIQSISDALSLCPYSESLNEMKAEALMLLRRYDELIQLCDQTLESAEINSSLSTPIDQARAWRCYFKSKAYFCLGRLDEALSLLQEQERVEGIDDRCGSRSSSLILLSATLRELLRLKIAGNTAFKAGRHSEAVEHYTAALTYNIESRPFAAVCFCNRAAAYQSLGQITDAISDCSLAIALDPNYPKAISRRATLLEMIRDYSQASSDLHRLVSLLERKLEDQSGGRRATSNGDDPKLVRLRLSKVEDKARKEIPLDIYKILGIETSSDAAEIKKAYRKAALRHHPDKAGQLLVRSENTDGGLWKEVADEVRRDADHLFKIIGEAYAILSDPSKRLQYDAEEEIITCQKGNSGGSTPRSQSDFYSSPSERSNRWQSRDPWKSYGNSNQRCSGSYRTNRYF